MYEDNRRYPVQCEVKPNCEEEDSLTHMLQCCGMVLPIEWVEESAQVEFLVKLARAAKVANPGRPSPIKTVKDGEIEITFPPSPTRTEGEISLEL